MKNRNTKVITSALAASALCFMLTGVASADGIYGVWKTESTEKGYLLVNIQPCGNDVCGTIEDAYSLDGIVDPDYKHKGEQMIWDMKPKGDTNWAKGKIWDPSKDKTYKSKMKLAGDTLNVSGCIAFICKSQSWTRAESPQQ